MHLKGTITTTQSDTPIAVTNHLNFLMASGFYVQLYQDIFVVTVTCCFDFI